MSDFATDPTDESALIMEMLFDIKRGVARILWLLEEDDGEEEEGDEASDG
jgi:hypothetical protein